MSEMNWPLIILVGLTFLSVTACAILVMLHHYAGKNGKLNHLNALIDKARRDLTQIEDKREEYERAKKFVDERQGWEAEKNALMEAVIAKEQEVQKLGDQKDQLVLEIEKLSPVVDGLKELEKETEEARTAVANLTSERKTINEQVGQLRNEIGELEQKKGTLLAEHKEVELDIASKESKFKSLADEVKKLEDDLRGKREKLDLDIKALTEVEHDLVAGGAESAALKKQNAELKDDNKALSVENKKLQDANQRLSPIVTSLEARKTAVEQWMKDNASRLANMEDLDRKIAQKKEDYAAIGKRIEDAQKTLAETMKAVEKALDRLAKMNVSGVQTLRLSSFDGLKNGEGAFRLPDVNVCEPAFGANEEADALRVVGEHFAANGFEVPQRLLYAFHTSLKTSDMSSLTVMAGVSGTGKSAIPKLYSEAMGIFFSPLAVEPRWDSPKDLMGFFNYVTNRYEPTPLARAMFQFQGLWDDDFRPDMALDKYMFMPMLDEMNLARIEYYFSEFLSKLEMRRLVARDGRLLKEHEPLIGLEIFGGCHKMIEGKQVDEGSKFLFANTNTLFVGTMNEDETTQSLSDKVIDRANVLYFGRPGRLQPQAGAGRSARLVQTR